MVLTNSRNQMRRGATLWGKLLFGVALVFYPCLAHAAAQRGQWIVPPGDVACPVNTYTYLRKTVNLKSLSGDLTLQMAADSNAHLWINGHIVRRKVTRFFERFIGTETIAPRSLLHTGLNTVVVLLHSWGPIVTFQRDGCAHSGLYVSSSWIWSDSGWKVHAADEFEQNTIQIKGVKGLDPRIRFAQFVLGEHLPQASMFSATYDDSGWGHATVVANGPWPEHPLPTGVRGQREVPVRPVLLLAQGSSDETHVVGVHPVAIEKAMFNANMSVSGTQALPLPSHLEIRGRAGETRYITVDFGRPVHGFPFLSGLARGASPTVDFAYEEIAQSPRTGELLVRSTGWLNPEAIVGEGYIDRYSAPLGAQRMELPDERTARWWTLHFYFPAEGSFRIDDFGFVSSQYPTDIQGTFHASDPRIAQIVKLSLEHAIISMSDTYVDTPGREDGQWLEDARLRAELSSQWFGDVKLRQLFLRLVAESQKPNGTFHPFPPSNYPIVSNADWAAEWVGALYDDYMWTGETKRIKMYWPQVAAYWKRVFASLQPDGLWVQKAVFADIRVGVHPAEHQSSGIVSAQLIDRLALSIMMAKAINQSEAVDWQKTHDLMLTAFRKHHLVPSSRGIPLHVDDVYDPLRESSPRGYSQAAQAMSIDAGLLSPEEAKADLEHAFTSPSGSPPTGVDRWNNPTYLYRALTALSDFGLAERGTQHLIERFQPYLPADPHNRTPTILQGVDGGPLPEYWISHDDLNLPPGVPASTQPIDPTGSHGWNSVGLVWLHKSLLGVTIKSPGGEQIKVQPNSGGMAQIDGTTVTPHGPVSVSWTPGMLSLEIRLPRHVVADVVLPAQLVEVLSTLHIPAGCKAETNGTYRCQGSETLVFSGHR
jgi:hypothetical protein